MSNDGITTAVSTTSAAGDGGGGAAGARAELRLDPPAARAAIRAVRAVVDRLAQVRAADAQRPRPVPAGDEVSVAVATSVVETAATRDRVEDRGLRALADLAGAVERRIDGVQSVDRESAAAIAAWS